MKIYTQMSRNDSFLKYHISEHKLQLLGNVHIWGKICCTCLVILVPAETAACIHRPDGDFLRSRAKQHARNTNSWVTGWRSLLCLSGDIFVTLKPLKQKSKCLRGNRNKAIIPFSISSQRQCDKSFWVKITLNCQRRPGERTGTVWLPFKGRWTSESRKSFVFIWHWTIHLKKYIYQWLEFRMI